MFEDLGKFFKAKKRVPPLVEEYRERAELMQSYTTPAELLQVDIDDLGKQLYKMQIEYNMEDCVPARKKSKSPIEFYTYTQIGTNISSSTASTSNFYNQYGAITLYNYWDNKETL